MFEFKCIRKCFVDRIYFEGEIVYRDMSKNTNFKNLNPVVEEIMLPDHVIENGSLKKKPTATN